MKDYIIFVKRKNPHQLLIGWFLCNFTIILYSVDFIKCFETLKVLQKTKDADFGLNLEIVENIHELDFYPDI